MAEEFDVSVRTVRRLYGGFSSRGDEAVWNGYTRCGASQPNRTSSKLLDEASQLREQHPTWGAPLIRVMMNQGRRRRQLPSARTLQRWFQENELPAAPAGRRPALDDGRAEQPHQVWQMDASERVPLANGKCISWLRIVDEWTGAVLHTTVFGKASFSTVGAGAVRARLRAAFSLWGRPNSFRVDNGFPWGSSGDLPTDLAMWLIGLKISIIWNPPCQPQKNGVVERSQGVGKSWAEPGACQSVKELQQRFRTMDRIQREEYPYQKGRSRLEVFPQLRHSSRLYDTAWEQKHWDREAVLEHVSEYLITRRVDRAGLISIYNRNYYVGKHHQSTVVSVILDPLSLKWIILDDQGRELRTHPAEQLTHDRIAALNVTHRRKQPK